MGARNTAGAKGFHKFLMMTPNLKSATNRPTRVIRVP